jgi:redox-sensitive bicupin YhaK (pirin superfamily)
MTTQTIRPLQTVIHGQAVTDGGGVQIHRSLGTRELRHLDPFLMLDEIHSDDPNDYGAGFPPHPHRGFQTLTYLLAGHLRHEDVKGNSGLVRAGGMQWMNAGSGIIHSEMPEQENGLLWGFQLWVNLPAAHKMSAPAYRDIQPESIPTSHPAPGVTVRTLAAPTPGEAPLQDPHTDLLFLDVRLEPQAQYTRAVTGNAFVYVYEGTVQVGGQTVQAHQLAVLGDGNLVTLQATAEPSGMLMLSARPIGEPIVAKGPFVMNTQAEIETAFADYQRNQLVK